MTKQSIIENTRILVYEDLNGFNIPLQSIRKIISLANNVADKYEDLEMGSFTYEIYNDVIENGVLNVQVRYLATIRAEIKRLSITNPSIQHAMFGDLDRALEPLKTAIETLLKYSGNLMGYFILTEKYKKASFKNNRFLLTKDDEESLKDEFCRIYVDDEKQSTALDSLRSFVDAYNTLLDSVSNMNQGMTDDMIRNPLKVWEYIQIENQKASVYNPNLGYFLQTAQ
jgi:hypothetical protein